MTDINEVWTDYFVELEPDRRFALLERLTDAGAEGTAFCHQLYEERYRDPRDPGKTVDNWLWKLVYFPGLYRRRKMLAKPLKREMEEALASLHLDRVDRLSEDEQTLLTLEFRNTARRYLSTCRSSGYGSRLLGFKKASEEEKLVRAAEDIWAAARGLPRQAGLEESFHLWREALHSELLDFDPACGVRYEQLEQQEG